MWGTLVGTRLGEWRNSGCDIYHESVRWLMRRTCKDILLDDARVLSNADRFWISCKQFTTTFHPKSAVGDESTDPGQRVHHDRYARKWRSWSLWIDQLSSHQPLHCSCTLHSTTAPYGFKFKTEPSGREKLGLVMSLSNTYGFRAKLI